jgi:hypothetical protein
MDLITFVDDFSVFEIEYTKISMRERIYYVERRLLELRVGCFAW